VFKLLFGLLCAIFLPTFSLLSLNASIEKKEPLPNSTVLINQKFHKANLEFMQRWQVFGGDSRSFTLWKADWNEKELQERFQQLWEERLALQLLNPEDCKKKGAVWLFKEPYKMAKNFELWHSRYPYPGSFAYNLADPLYNASLITLHKKRFLALEAPTEENLAIFYQLLDTYQVTQLVRLTPSKSGKKECSVPYWEGKVTMDPETGHPSLIIKDRKIPYFATDGWKDHQAIDPEKLLALVKGVQQSNKEGEKIIAVHCRAGVGRTGTFIAAYVLIDEIDQQLAQGIPIDQLEISIDKVLWELSLQRPFAVNYSSYYLSLHRLINHYVLLLSYAKKT
jgi:hypothetical protein